MTGVAAIILAAGEGRRFGAGSEDSKLTALLDGRPLIRHVADAVLTSWAKPIFVVTGHAHEKVEDAIFGLNLRILLNPFAANGLSSSLKLGLANVPEDASGAIILLGDMPYVTERLINRLIDAFAASPSGTIAVVPVFRGRRGNPSLLSRRSFREVETIQGDQGARGLLDKKTHGVIEIPIDDPGIAFDIDTVEMLAQAPILRPVKA